MPPPQLSPILTPEEDSALPLVNLQHLGSRFSRPESWKPNDPMLHRHSRARRIVQGWWRCAVLGWTILLTIILTHRLTTAHYLLPAVATNSANNLEPPLIVGDPSEDASGPSTYPSDPSSSTLAQASGRYTLHTGRPPPPYYAEWFNFAKEKKCLIDEYAQIHRDFRPFYQLATDNATSFRDMVDRAGPAAAVWDAVIATMVIRNGQVSMTGNTAYGWYLSDTVGRFSRWLPDMTFFLNGKDEPRVAFNYRAHGARRKAALVTDSTPFLQSHRPTGEFFAHQSGCDIPMEATGFLSSANNFSGFLIESAKPGYTTDLYPMLSMSKISPCFADILYPTQYYYDRSSWSGKFAFADNVPWAKKKSLLYWRGTTTGGMIRGDYHRYTRFRLMHIGSRHPDLMDVRLTAIAEPHCEEGCDREAVISAYNISGKGDPKEDVYGFKYALDVDGATFSGRFLGLMRSGSLVFKSTFFEEYFNDWLRPFEHYIPVLPDLSDLVQKVEWANKNSEEARLIQQRGLEVARRVITDDQNDCYLYAAVLEWAQLLEYAKGNSA
ncbi:CAP10 domain-containing protein [Mycena venus]|uniref:CAP10 domain-containing protein n=1 Tax=Mycena venus TaxID=2733690 RepID=A0A8H6XP25_9AGAR|nr:CAP10 domain-containing protein [Mycena venus]